MITETERVKLNAQPINTNSLNISSEMHCGINYKQWRWKGRANDKLVHQMTTKRHTSILHSEYYFSSLRRAHTKIAVCNCYLYTRLQFVFGLFIIGQFAYYRPVEDLIFQNKTKSTSIITWSCRQEIYTYFLDQTAMKAERLILSHKIKKIKRMVCM